MTSFCQGVLESRVCARFQGSRKAAKELGRSSVAEGLPGMHEACLLPLAERKGEGEGEEKGRER